MSCTVHVTYYEPVKSVLVGDCLIPFAERLARMPGAGPVHLERHWKFGPHVRVCVPGSLSADEVSTLLGSIESYLAAHPSGAEIDLDAYAATSHGLGTAELDPPPYEPLRADNSVVVCEYRPRLDLLEGGAQIREEFLHRALPLVHRIVADVGGDEQRRLRLVMALFTILARFWTPYGFGGGTMAYRSHVNWYLNLHDREGRVRTHLERAFALQRDASVALVARVASAPVDELTADPILGPWAAHVAWAWREMAPLAEAQLIRNTDLPYLRVASEISPEAAVPWTGEWDSLSEFAKEMKRSGLHPQNTHPLEFAVYRWILNLTYDILPLFDVSPLERILAGWLVAESADHIEGTNWRRRLRLEPKAG